MKSKVEKWLEKRGQDIKEEWMDSIKIRIEKCESPLEKFFLIEWRYQIEGYSNPEGFPGFFIYPQFQINNFTIDFAIIYITFDEWDKHHKNNFVSIKDKILLVEIDSYLWHGAEPEQFAKEKERERELQKEGYKLMRFSGREIYKDVENCVREVINHFIKEEE